VAKSDTTEVREGGSAATFCGDAAGSRVNTLCSLSAALGAAVALGRGDSPWAAR
jgi:hypothetical protein